MAGGASSGICLSTTARRTPFPAALAAASIAPATAAAACAACADACLCPDGSL
jgi:hypothetical protein